MSRSAVLYIGCLALLAGGVLCGRKARSRLDASQRPAHAIGMAVIGLSAFSIWFGLDSSGCGIVIAGSFVALGFGLGLLKRRREELEPLMWLAIAAILVGGTIVPLVRALAGGSPLPGSLDTVLAGVGGGPRATNGLKAL